MSSYKNTYCKDRIANSSSCSKHKGSILVVDDDKDILITIEAFLQEYGGFCVKTFTDASLVLKHFHLTTKASLFT
jgi:FixJ family two-component response regulator